MPLVRPLAQQIRRAEPGRGIVWIVQLPSAEPGQLREANSGGKTEPDMLYDSGGKWGFYSKVRDSSRGMHFAASPQATPFDPDSYHSIRFIQGRWPLMTNLRMLP